MLVISIIPLTTVVFLLLYATVESTLATMISKLFAPPHVTIPKAVNSMLNKITEKIVFFPFSTCLVKIIFLTHPTRFIAIPV